MNLGEAWVFCDGDPAQQARQLVGVLDRNEITYRHPADGKVWIFDRTGERESVSSLQDGLDRFSEEPLLQLWLDADTDVACWPVIAEDLLVFGLDGLTVQMAAKVVSALVTAFVVLPGSKALLVDRSLPYEEGWHETATLVADHPGAFDLLLLRGEGDTVRVWSRPDSWLRTDS